jgi:pilus assembly protein Flp/PilA
VFRAGLLSGYRRVKRFNRNMTRLVDNESGQDLIEYALVAALVALGAIASMKTLGTKLTTAFTYIGTTLSSAT